eukprot:COSAG01_NODE_12549_length_1721_cov_9.601110_2_plen_189_part_00
MIIYSSHTRERYPPIVQIITSPLLPFSPRIPEKKAGFNSGPRGSYNRTTVIPTAGPSQRERASQERPRQSRVLARLPPSALCCVRTCTSTAVRTAVVTCAALTSAACLMLPAAGCVRGGHDGAILVFVPSDGKTTKEAQLGKIASPHASARLRFRGSWQHGNVGEGAEEVQEARRGQAPEEEGAKSKR